jgi:hypothetical protein
MQIKWLINGDNAGVHKGYYYDLLTALNHGQ